MTQRPDAPLADIHGRKVLFAMAAEAEYGPHLRKRFTPLLTGVGPVESAVALATALTRLDAAGSLPDLVVSLGSAGSRVLEHCGIYQVSDVTYRDMDASALGFEKGVTPFLDLPAALPLPYIIPGIPRASLASGASVVSGIGFEGILAQMVDMETYSIVRAASGFGIPVVALRGISDGRSDLLGMSDWTEYLHVVDEKLAGAVDRLSEALASDRIPV